MGEGSAAVMGAVVVWVVGRPQGIDPTGWTAGEGTVVGREGSAAVMGAVVVWVVGRPQGIAPTG